MNWKKFGAFLCAASLAVLLPGPEPAKQADAPAEVTLSDPPLVALTFDDGPRSSTTTALLDGLSRRGVRARIRVSGHLCIKCSCDLVGRCGDLVRVAS